MDHSSKLVHGAPDLFELSAKLIVRLKNQHKVRHKRYLR